MKFYEIPLDTDLSQTSYRARKDTEKCIYIEYNEGFVGENWQEITEEKAREVAPEFFIESTPPAEPLSDSEVAIYDTQANVEYLVCLSELGL